MYKIFLKNKLIYFLFIMICVPQMVFGDTVISEVVSISARVVDSGSGLGGGGGINIPTTITFSGMAYPFSIVYLLKDGQIVSSTTTNKFANFTISLSGLNTNTYTFSLYSEDSNNTKSSFFSFPILITSGTTVNINNIFLSPTLNTDKIEVKQGDNIVIFGKSIPLKEVIVSLRLEQEYLYNVFSGITGDYSINIDTSNLELGRYQAKSKSIINNQDGLYSVPVSFLVGEDNKLTNNISCLLLKGDLNCDNHVNLTDFSIMAYWYKKLNPPAKIDLNTDGGVSMVDFSIMAFNWTG